MEYFNHRVRAYVNGAIIAINILFFIFLEIHGSTENDMKLMLHYGAMYAPAVVKGQEYYRLLVSIFMHFGFSHLLNNMIILFVLGDNLERALGKVKYLVFYLTCGVGANIISMLININEYRHVVSAGASGAIFGVIGGLLYAVSINRGRLGDLSSRQLILLVICSLYHGFTGIGVDNMAHIGGLVLGVLLAAVMYQRPEHPLEERM
ncbi:rhomboid family intramembrane serine protease [Lachnospiraceae bacterium 62-35]